VTSDWDKPLKRLLRKHGWRFHRAAAGSHEIWRHPDRPHPVTVPNGTRSRHTANAVLKQAGIREKV
jgi:predicted RNA binding protein YcfA (HicA-like mRNA interferase family)